MNIQALETRIALMVERVLERNLNQIQKLSLKFYSPASVAEMLEVDAQTVRNLCNKGEIRSIRVGKEIRIEQKELLKWLETFN